MALTRQKKTQQVEALSKQLESSTSAIVGTFAKLTVSQDFELRKVVREAGGTYKVLKNKLAARASKGTQVEAALQGLKGVSSVAYTSGDPVALTKAVSKWVGDNAEFTFKLGIVDGALISVEEIKQLATMPGKDELFSKLLFLISAPAQRLATVLNATGRDLAVVVNQAVEQEKFSGPSVAASAAASVPAPDEAPTAPVAATPVAETAAGKTAAEEMAQPVSPAAETMGTVTEVDAQADPAQPESGSASQAASAATEAPAEGAPAEEQAAE